jgi:hypothetical protein
VVCGLERENLTNLDGLRDVDVRLVNRGYDPREVSCYLTSWAPEGGDFLAQIKKTVTIPVGEAANLDFNGALGVSAKWGHYSLSCDLPRWVAILNILTREY